MKKTFSIFTFVFALLAITTVVSAQKDILVTSNIEVPGGGLFSIGGDEKGPYRNGVDSVVSRIQPVGDWELSMLSSTTRKTYINFGTRANDNTSPKLPPPAGYYQVRFLTQCPAPLPNLTLLNPTQNCKMVVAVNVGVDRYSIRFGYKTNTNPVKWTCKATANGKCNSWELKSTTIGTREVTAELLKITTVRGKFVEESYGNYNFSFAASVTNP